MVKRIIVLACVAGCGPAPREALQDGSSADAIGVPEGAWEPDPGVGRSSARIVADGSDIWIVYARVPASPASEVWLTKTTSTGDVVVAPTRVDGPELAAWPISIARSGDNVAVVFQHSAGSLPPRLRVYDRTGQPLRNQGHLVPISTLGGTYMTNLALVARADGSMRLFAVHYDPGLATETAVVELDASGDPVGEATLFGIDDESTPVGLAAAVDADGSALVAWDRRYDVCAGHTHSDATLFTKVAVEGAIDPVIDVGPLGRADREPSLAALGSTSYLARTSDTDFGSVIRLSRARDASIAVTDIGDPQQLNHASMLALAEPGRGAIAWSTHEPAIRLASLRDDGTSLVVGPVHVIPLPSMVSFRGIVHVGDERYVVSWTSESWTAQQSQQRLYAMVVDLATTPKLASTGPATQRPPSAQRRCSH